VGSSSSAASTSPRWERRVLKNPTPLTTTRSHMFRVTHMRGATTSRCLSGCSMRQMGMSAAAHASAKHHDGRRLHLRARSLCARHSEAARLPACSRLRRSELVGLAWEKAVTGTRCLRIDARPRPDPPKNAIANLVPRPVAPVHGELPPSRALALSVNQRRRGALGGRLSSVSERSKAGDAQQAYGLIKGASASPRFDQ